MLERLPDLLLLLLGFTFLAMAAQKMGGWFKRLHLPSITGMLLTGILVGPYAIDFLDHHRLEQLSFLNQIALAFIAFAAGTELYLKEIRSRIKNIAWQTGFLMLAIFSISTTAFYLLGTQIPFMKDMNHASKLAVGILGGTIFVARSPSSAIAIKRELRAKGPFTKTAIGVTVIVDFLVIILFAITFSAALNLTKGEAFNWHFVLDIFFELQLALLIGYIVSRMLIFLYGRNIHQGFKLAGLLLIGYSVYFASHYVQHISGLHLPFEIHAEPLLICIIASFIMTNYSPHRLELQEGIHKLGPYVYLVFFTLTGAHLALDVFARVWQLALALFAIRIGAIMVGTYIGATVSREEPKYRRYSWMSFITQAGVGIGLATVIAQEFPGWGQAFYTMVLSVIVLNEIVGPMLFKFAIRRMGESHEKHRVHEGDGIRDAIIFGMEPQSISLAKQLKEHKWEAKIVDCRNLSDKDQILDIKVEHINDFTLENLASIECEKAEAMVLMLSDEENYALAEIIYEHIGTKEVVVRLNDRVYFEKFHELGALIVNPETAIVSLMDNFVRSPNATSLLLGMENTNETIDVEIRDRALHGIQIKFLNLPPDIIILSVQRRNQVIISHGYTRLRLGDIVTVVGSPESLEDVILEFGENE